MDKENGRLSPAEKNEFAKVKGKCMYCSKCDTYHMLMNVEFAGTKCETCGTILTDLNISDAGQLVG